MPVGAEAQLRNMGTGFEMHVEKTGESEWEHRYGVCGNQSNPYLFEHWNDAIYNIRFAMKTDPNPGGYRVQVGACGTYGEDFILFEKWGGKGGFQEWLEDNIR